MSSAFLVYFETESALITFLAYKISLAMGIYCNIIITHIAIDVIHIQSHSQRIIRIQGTTVKLKYLCVRLP